MKFWIRLFLSLALITLLFVYAVDAQEFVRVLQQFHPAYLVLALAVVTLDRILMTFKWTLLLRAQGHRLPLWHGVTIYCSSMVWGLALPTTVGADAVRAMMVTRRGFSGTDVVTSIVIERMVGFVVALALCVVSLTVLRSLNLVDGRFDQALLLVFVAFSGAIILLLASLNESLVGFVLARLPKALREMKASDYFARFASAYRSLGRSRTTLGAFSALTVLEQLLSVLLPWVIALGLGIRVDLWVLLGVLPISTLISRLPISVDGLGVFEAVFVGLLVLAGLNAESALAMAISGRIIQVLAFLPWWLAQVAWFGGFRPPKAHAREVRLSP